MHGTAMGEWKEGLRIAAASTLLAIMALAIGAGAAIVMGAVN